MSGRSDLIRGRGLQRGMMHLCLCLLSLSLTVQAEIVSRELGKTSSGKTITGYVFQPGRSSRRQLRNQDSVFGGRRVRSRRSRGIDYGYNSLICAPYFYYHVPLNYRYPIHRYQSGGARLSVYLSF